MITISISEETETKDEMADVLRRIAKMIEDGNTSGYYPTWSMDGEDEDEEIEKPVSRPMPFTTLPTFPNGFNVNALKEQAQSIRTAKGSLPAVKYIKEELGCQLSEAKCFLDTYTN